MKTPLQVYQEYIFSKKFEENIEQKKIICLFDEIFKKLPLRQQNKTYFNSFKKLFQTKNSTPKGIYLYGGVGIGKTWMMDIFYSCIPETYRFRMHFHQFMRKMHQELKIYQGKKNPLDYIAQKIAKQTPVVCFDEFFVVDIADAMILHQVLKALFKQGITFITTSNSHPDDLYKNGVSRELFLPAIEFIKQNTEIIFLKSAKDYRVQFTGKNSLYFWPNNSENLNKFQNLFLMQAPHHIVENIFLKIENRKISAKQISDKAVWFDFQVLCTAPRSQVDYLEIIQRFKVIFISNVPQLNDKSINELHYFIYLIDILYDNKIKLFLMADPPLHEIYIGKKMQKLFERTQSRLHEMLIASETYTSS